MVRRCQVANNGVRVRFIEFRKILDGIVLLVAEVGYLTEINRTRQGTVAEARPSTANPSTTIVLHLAS